MTVRSAVIIGGGISGLSAAFFLSQKASGERSPLKITILEASDRLGGVLRTFSHQDLRIEAGADAFYGGQGDALDLCRALGLENDVIEAAPCFRNFFYLKNKKSFPTQGFPGRWSDVFDFLGNSQLSLGAKCRMLMEVFVPTRIGDEDESIEDFVSRRLGPNFYREVVEPLVRGVYMSDPQRASLKALFPKWQEAEEVYGSLTRSLLEKKREKGVEAATKFFTLKQGLEGLVRALERELRGCELRRSTPVRQCAYDAGWNISLEDGSVLRADMLGLAMNVCDSARLLSETEPQLSRSLSAVRYDPIATVNLVFRAKDVPAKSVSPGFWVPADDKPYPFSSLKCLGVSENGKFMLARAFISEALLPGVFQEKDDVLEQKVASYSCDLLDIQRQPCFNEVRRYPRGLPQYEVGHLERVADIEKESARYPGLFLAGNGFQGFGITDCIRRARMAVSSLRFPVL